jgi:hypothetical protein
MRQRFLLGIVFLITAVAPAWAESYGIPFRFERNQGQAPQDAEYIAQAGSYKAYLGEREVVMKLAQNPIRMRFAGASGNIRIEPLEELPFRTNYYHGGDISKWHTGIRNYQRLIYKNVYPGIDVVFRSDGRALAFDFILQPGVSHQPLELTFSGQESIDIAQDGDLVLATSQGEARLKVPVIYQDSNGKRNSIEGRFIRDGNNVRIDIGSYDPSQSLVIDPTLVFSTYVSLGGVETATDIKVDPAGNLYVSYYTFDALDNNEYGFVVQKIARDGSQGYITQLRTSHHARANAIVLDSSGNVYVTGSWHRRTGNPDSDFPAVNALQPRAAGDGDAVVVKLDSAGKIVFSTFLGGSGVDAGSSITLDTFGNLYVAGTTSSTDFPTRNPYQGALAGSDDIFLTKIDNSGTAILFSTYFGGDNRDLVNKVVLDAGGNIYLAGNTKSRTFPGISGDLQASSGDCPFNQFSNTDRSCPLIFVSELNPAATAVVKSQVLTRTAEQNDLRGFVLGDDGAIYLGRGRSTADGPPTAFFLEKFDASGNLVYSRSIPATIYDVTTDRNGNVYVTGGIAGYGHNDLGPEFPIVNSFRPLPANDVFVTKFPPSGGTPLYSTFLSGTCYVCVQGSTGNTFETGFVITADAEGRAYVGGVAAAEDFPTTNGTRRSSMSMISDRDAIVFVLDLNANDTGTRYTRLEETSGAIVYSGNWYTNGSPYAGHSAGFARLAMDTGATFSTGFSGSGGIQWYGCKDQWSGIANVYVDGSLHSTVDTYGTADNCHMLLWSANVSSGSHTLKVEVTGTRNPSSEGYWVWLDTIEITSAGDITLGAASGSGSSGGGSGGGSSASFTRVEETDPSVQLGSGWYRNSNDAHSGSSAVLALDAGTRATFTFNGTAVRWIGMKDAWSGIATVTLDGVSKGEVDTYGTSGAQQVLYSIEGLASGTHTLVIEATGRHGSSSASSWVWIDAFGIWGQ